MIRTVIATVAAPRRGSLVDDRRPGDAASAQLGRWQVSRV